jgi:hypothetical protein
MLAKVRFIKRVTRVLQVPPTRTPSHLLNDMQRTRLDSLSANR